METQAELEKLYGTQGHEDGILFRNCFYSVSDWKDMVNAFSGTPRQLKNIEKQITPAVATWTWKKQYSRSLAQFVAVKSDYEIKVGKRNK